MPEEGKGRAGVRSVELCLNLGSQLTPASVMGRDIGIGKEARGMTCSAKDS